MRWLPCQVVRVVLSEDTVPDGPCQAYDQQLKLLRLCKRSSDPYSSCPCCRVIACCVVARCAKIVFLPSSVPPTWHD